MHITLYVHDFHPQIGHSRAMQELINGLAPDQITSISSIEVVAFSATDLNKMFPSFQCPKHFTKIPFPNIKPFLIKMFLYHVVSFIHSITLGKERTKIGIGIACLNVDVINVQFIHEQWKMHFFEKRKMTIIPLIYKKILFSYFALVESYIYSPHRKTKYIVIANFLKKFLEKKFNTISSKITLIPSGVNTAEFTLTHYQNQENFQNLSTNYPALKNIDPNKPVALFIGAFERKGLSRVLDALKSTPDAQLIVIGKSEQSKFEMPQLPFKVVHIPFTKEVNLFYQLADLFIFPTMYEPFGLVIIEAYVMGLDLIIPNENVGASEIIAQTDGIYYCPQEGVIQLPRLKKISLEEKLNRRAERLAQIQQYNWVESSKKFYSIL